MSNLFCALVTIIIITRAQNKFDIKMSMCAADPCCWYVYFFHKLIYDADTCVGKPRYSLISLHASYVQAVLSEKCYLPDKHKQHFAHPARTAL